MSHPGRWYLLQGLNSQIWTKSQGCVPLIRAILRLKYSSGAGRSKGANGAGSSDELPSQWEGLTRARGEGWVDCAVLSESRAGLRVPAREPGRAAGRIPWSGPGTTLEVAVEDMVRWEKERKRIRQNKFKLYEWQKCLRVRIVEGAWLF